MKKLTLFSSLAAAATVAALVLFGSCENPTDAEKSTPADPATLKNITAFSFASPAATGTVSASTIAVTVPFGTDVTALVATFTTNGESVKVGDVAQVSGTTANNFTNPVTYTVTAKDASTKTYIVTVTVAPEDTSPKVDISKVKIDLDITFASSSSETQAYYQANLFIMDKSGNDVKYSSVQCKIGETTLSLADTADWGTRYYANIGLMNEGDQISFEIRDDTLGIHRGTLTLPAPLSAISVSPNLPAPGTANTVNDYTVSWTPKPGVTGYTACIGYYTGLQEDGNTYRYIGRYTTTGSYRFTTLDQFAAMCFEYDWIIFEVFTTNAIFLTNFFEGSSAEITSITSPKKTNYVSAN